MPERSESRKIETRIGAMVVPQRLSVEAGIPSGPGANEGFKLSIAFETEYSSMIGKLGAIASSGTFDSASAICLSSVTAGRKVAPQREAKISQTAEGFLPLRPL